MFERKPKLLDLFCCAGGVAVGSSRAGFNVVGVDIALCANIRETVLVLLINEQGEKEKGRDEREFSWCGSFPWGFG